jgi:hypothetical protein
VLLHPPSSRAMCFTPELCTLVRLHSSPPARPSCLCVSGRLPRVARQARLYTPVHCTGAHPCLSRSALMLLSLSAARPAVPPDMLRSPVPARILPVCRDDLGPMRPTIRPNLRPHLTMSPEPIRVSLPFRRVHPTIRLHVVPAASAARATTSPRVPRVRSCNPPNARHQLASRDAHRSSPEHRRPCVPESAAACLPTSCHQRPPHRRRAAMVLSAFSP